MTDTGQGETSREMLRRILRESLQLDDLPGACDVRRSDIDAWDSVSNLRLLLAVEQEFDVTLDEASFADVETLSDIEALLRRAGVLI